MRLTGSPAFRKCCSVLLLAGLLISAGPAPATRADIDGRIGHTALPTVGRNAGITHLELFPYMMLGDDQIAFGNARAFLSNNGRIGGNFGAGYRFLEPSEIFVLGINGYIDVDNTSGKMYQQLSLGLEAMTRFGGVTSNFYFPVGEDDRQLREYRSNGRFEGNQILFDNVNVRGQAMRGVDLMVGAFLPGEYAERYQLEMSAGWYTFFGDQTDNINGFKIQLDGLITEEIEAQVAITNDNYFGANATIGVGWRFGNRGPASTDIERQLRRFVDRNYNVIVSEWAISGSDIPLVNPLTGEAYNVQHVRPGAGSSGTQDDPFSSIAEAQAALNGEAGIIYVHPDSVISEFVQLEAGQYLLGGGIDHLLADHNYGNVLLPGDIIAGNRPIMQNSTNNAIVMNDNTWVAGFNINNPFGSAIVADGITNFRVNDINITGANSHAIMINNSTEGSLSNIHIQGGNGDGLHMTNIDGNLTLRDIYISGSAMNGVNISSTAAGGSLGTIDFLGDLIIENITVTRFLIDNLGTDDSDPDDVIEGTVRFARAYIDGANNGTGIQLTNNEGLIRFETVDVTTEGGSALVVHDSDRVFIGAGSLDTTNASVVDLDNSHVDLRLQSISADGGSNAIRMVDTVGRLVVFGSGTAGSGGTIKNITSDAIVMENSGQLGLQFVNFENNDGIARIDAANHFELGYAGISGTQTRLIDALNVKTFSITSSDFSDNASAQGIVYAVDKVGAYITRFNNNISTETPHKLFDVITLAGGESSTLNYSFQQNTVDMELAGAVGAGINWTGAMQADVRNNLMRGTANAQTVFDFHFGNSNNNALIAIRQNGIGLTGESSTGIRITSDAPVTSQISQNLIQFSGQNGTGMQISSNKASTFSITQNQIEDFAGGATGIQFPTMYKGSQIILNNNWIDLSYNDMFFDQGIVLNAVAGPDNPTVQFISSTNNVVRGANDAFSYPAGSAVGSVIINGSVIDL